jgi:hypothetical protein
MTDVDTLIRRIDQEMLTEVDREKAAWAEVAKANCERRSRLKRYDAVAQQVFDLVRLECTQEIVPVLLRFDKQSVLELPFDAVQDDAVVQWFDERIVAFVKLYIALVRQDADLREHLKDQLVEDPVGKIRFPK